MIVRRAEARDADEIVEMAYEFELYLIALDDALLQEPPAKGTFQRVLLEGFEDPKHFMVVAEEGAKLAGMADFWAYPEFLHGGLAGYMNNVYVREAWRGTGVGSMMLGALMDEARRRGVVAMHVPVKLKNLKAKKFYVKMGIDEELLMLERRLGE